LLRGLQYLKEAKAISVEIFGDSEQVIKQLNGHYECRNDILRLLRGVQGNPKKFSVSNSATYS
jgi:ribonuclease HI